MSARGVVQYVQRALWFWLGALGADGRYSKGDVDLLEKGEGVAAAGRTSRPHRLKLGLRAPNSLRLLPNPSTDPFPLPTVASART